MLLDRLHEAKLFRLLLPRSNDGIETDPVTFFHVIETISRGDASTAWCLSQAGGCAMTAAYLATEVAHDIFGKDPRAVLAWGPGPRVKAIECEGGHKVTGTWAFASGGRHATWLGAHCPIFTPDGSPKLGPSGRRLERTFLVPAKDVDWTDIWHVVGLRGTGSDTVHVDDLFVDDAHAFTRDYAPGRVVSEPLYLFQSMQLYAGGFACVALGTARAAVDAFADLVRTKTRAWAADAMAGDAAVLRELEEGLHRMDSNKLKQALKRLVPEYQPHLE